MKFELKKKKNNKPEKEPEYFNSATNMPTLNYNVYYMKPKETVLTFLVAFIVGAFVGYLFYGGIGKNEFGEPTRTTWILNILIPVVVGSIAGKLFLPIRVKSIIQKRKTELAHQFRDMLESLNTSLGSGKNVTDSFISVLDDLKLQYSEDAYILYELKVIISGIHNNVAIEDVLEDFGNRSGNEDIKSFANVFRIAYRTGGNIKDIIRNTHSIISEKMEISDEIETLVTSNKTEQNIMIVMPILLISVIKMMSPEFAENFVSPAGLISTTISIGFYVLAYFIGKEVLDIKI